MYLQSVESGAPTELGASYRHAGLNRPKGEAGVRGPTPWLGCSKLADAVALWKVFEHAFIMYRLVDPRAVSAAELDDRLHAARVLLLVRGEVEDLPEEKPKDLPIEEVNKLFWDLLTTEEKEARKKADEEKKEKQKKSK